MQTLETLEIGFPGEQCWSSKLQMWTGFLTEVCGAEFTQFAGGWGQNPQSPLTLNLNSTSLQSLLQKAVAPLCQDFRACRRRQVAHFLLTRQDSGEQVIYKVKDTWLGLGGELGTEEKPLLKTCALECPHSVWPGSQGSVQEFFSRKGCCLCVCSGHFFCKVSIALPIGK